MNFSLAKHSACFCIFVLAVFGTVPLVQAGVTEDSQEATVRIFQGKSVKDNPNGIDVESMGTGFAIGGGYVVTNNHVVAPEPLDYKPSERVYVVQKKGNSFIMHHAQVKWQQPNADLAIVYCPDLDVAKPFPIYTGALNASDEVYSIGFPGISDTSSRNIVREEEKLKIIIRAALEKWYENYKKRNRKEPTEAEVKNAIREIKKEFSDSFGRMNPQRDEMFDAFNVWLAQSSNKPANSWEITDIVLRKPTWKGFFIPTVTKGNIERTAVMPGFVDGEPIQIVQHSCNIQAGNSGGPLFTENGQVIGVVGRGFGGGGAGEVTWASGIQDVASWLDTHGVNYLVGDGSRSRSLQDKKVVIAVVASAGLGVLALLIALFRSPRGRQMVQNYSQVLSRQPAPAGVPANFPIPPPPPPPPPSAEPSPTWAMQGRSKDGQSFSLDFSANQFESNGGRLILGRTAELSHLMVGHSSVSKQHAHLIMRGRKLYVADRNSANGTLVNGQPTGKPFHEVPIADGNTITAGEVKFDLRQTSS